MIYLPKSEKKGFSKGVENDRNNRFQIGIHSVIHISTSNQWFLPSTLYPKQIAKEHWSRFLYRWKSLPFLHTRMLQNQQSQQFPFCRDENTVPVTHIVTPLRVERGESSFYFSDWFLEIQKINCKSWGNTIRETFSTFLILFGIYFF